MTTKDNKARLDIDDEFDALFSPREAPEGRISDLCRKFREAEATMLRYDADDEGSESAAARETAKRILEEMSAVQPGSHLDALAAIHFVRWYLMKNLLGAEFGHEERAVANQLDGLTQYLSDSMS